MEQHLQSSQSAQQQRGGHLHRWESRGANLSVAAAAAAVTPASSVGAITIGDVIMTPPATVEVAEDNAAGSGGSLAASESEDSTALSSGTSGGSAPLPSTSTLLSPAALAFNVSAAAAAANEASFLERSAAAEKELASLRRQLAAARAVADEERTELQYRAGPHTRPLLLSST